MILFFGSWFVLLKGLRTWDGEDIEWHGHQLISEAGPVDHALLTQENQMFLSLQTLG